MRLDDRLWMRRVDVVLGPLWMRLLRPGERVLRGWRLRVYCTALKAHRWLWVRGVAL